MADDSNYESLGTAGTLDGTEYVPMKKDGWQVKTLLSAIKTYVLGGVDVSELEKLDGVTAGTVTASKAVVVDANKDIGDFRNVTAAKFIGQATQLFDGGAVPSNAAYGTSTLTMTGAIVPGARATTKLTSTGVNVSDGDTVTLNTTVYRFKNAPAQAYDVQIGGTAAASLDNLKAAINGSGTEGVEYFAGTAFHPTMYATTNTDTTQIVVARVVGVTANSYPSTSTAVTLSWEDTTVGGGTGDSNPGVAAETVTVGSVTYSFLDVLSEDYAINWAVANEVHFGTNTESALLNLKYVLNGGGIVGTDYSTGTVANPTANGTDVDADSLVVQADTIGTAGNGIATTSVLANGGFGAAATAGGVDGTVGAAGEVRWDTSAGYIYIATQANTTTTDYWYKAQITKV